jgi:hypothetical protein
MYTDEQIAKMNPEIHPAIKMAKTWGGAISEEEYNKKFEDFKKWVLTKRSYIVENYQPNDGKVFLNIIAANEVKAFLKAGFDFNYDYLNKMIENCTITKNLPLIDQELSDRLIPIRESMTVLAVASNGLWGAKQEFKNNASSQKNKSQEIIKLTKNSLTLLAQGPIGKIEYFSKIKEVMQKDSKSDTPPTATFIKALKTIKHEVNKNIYKEKTNGFIYSPEV